MEVGAETNSRKEPKGRREALEMARQASRLVAAKGTTVRELDLASKPHEAEILALMLGPTGNLRAPTFVAGGTLYVGFPREGFESLG